MKSVINLKHIIGGTVDPNDYWYLASGELAHSSIAFNGPATSWTGSLWGADGRLIATGNRTVFDPRPLAPPAGNQKKGKK